MTGKIDEKKIIPVICRVMGIDENEVVDYNIKYQRDKLFSVVLEIKTSPQPIIISVHEEPDYFITFGRHYSAALVEYPNIFSIRLI